MSVGIAKNIPASRGGENLYYPPLRVYYPKLYRKPEIRGRILKRQVLQSANFKRDYVAASAILIFILIVVLELTLAVAIPSYLYREDTMALQVRRLKLFESFDSARNRCNNAKPQDTAAKMELKLVEWNLDLLARYLREERNNLSSDEIALLQNYVNDSLAILKKLSSGGSFSNETKFDTATYVESLIPKRGEKTNAGKKPARQNP